MKAILFVALAAAAAAIDVVDPDTTVLTASNFDSFTKEGTSLVEFYAPWCGHCKSLAPEYAKAATILKNFDVKLGKVDATVESALGSQFKVEGYPTLKIFRDGVPSDYDGPRDSAGIVSYMKKKAGPSAKPFGSVEEATKYAETIKAPVIVGTFATADTAAAKAFLGTAAALRDKFTFAIVTGSKAADGVTRVFPTKGARYFGEAATAKYDGAAADVDALSAWVPQAATPVAGILDADSAHIYGQGVTLPIVTVYVDKVDAAKDPSGTKYFLNRIRKVAAEYAGKALFNLGVTGASPFEVVKGAKYNIGVRADGKNYRLEKPTAKFDTAVLGDFTKAYFAGELEQFIKSEPVPEQTGDVTVLVGKNFDAETEGKAGLIEFYAPWCGHCKTLEPKWNELGAKAKKAAPGVLIAKMDKTANDAPTKYEVRGFPTIYYVDGKGGFEQYNGAREVKDFVKFLKGKGVWKKD